MHRFCDAFERVRAEIAILEGSHRQLMSVLTQDHAVGVGQCLQSRRQIRRVAQCQCFFAVPLPTSPTTTTPVLMPTRTARGPTRSSSRVTSRRYQDPRALRVGHRPRALRVAEVHEQPVPEVLRDVSVITADHLGARALILAHDFAVRLRIQPVGQLGRANQIAKQHGQLPALGCPGDARLLVDRSQRRRGSLQNDATLVAKPGSRSQLHPAVRADPAHGSAARFAVPGVGLFGASTGNTARDPPLSGSIGGSAPSVYAARGRSPAA